MVRDRLQEFREIRKNEGLALDDTVIILFEENETQKQLLALLEKIGPLYTKLQRMVGTVEELQSMVHQHQHRDKVEDQVAKLKDQARKLKKELEEVKEESKINSVGLLEHVARTHHFSLCTHLTLILQQLSSIQAEAQNRHAQYVKKELIITGRAGYNEEELQSLLEEPPELFTQNIIRETQVARQQLSDLQARHEDFVKLENSLIELCTLFTEVSQLVAVQGENVTRIENNVYVAQAKTEQGKKELGSARENQSKALKKKFILGIILGVVLLIITLVLVFSFI